MPAPATCGTVDPCGGDPTGTWKVLGGCLPSGNFDGGTPTCTQVQILTLAFRGTMTFNADMTYTATNFTEDRAEVDTTPISCWGYKQTTCAEEDKALKEGVAAFPGGYASCTGSTTCACTVAQTGQTVIGGSGTYSLNGNLINFATATSSYSGFSYCVQDGFFHLLSAESVTYGTGPPTTVIGEDIVAQLQ